MTKFFAKNISESSFKWTLNGDEENLEFEAEVLGDEYHTIDELYNHRMVLNIALFHAWHELTTQFGVGGLSTNIQVMKSKLHNDGTMFEGYFIVMALTPVGQVSYHYKLEYWNKFQIPEVERTPEWDGHSSQNVLERLEKL